MANDHSLAAHTPTADYMERRLQQRTLELLGADKKFVNRFIPLPYTSKYPTTNKLLDAIITLSVDPVTKPLSLRGDLKKHPALDYLANGLVDKGYLKRYPGGGIGIGSGTGGGDPGDAPASSSDDPGLNISLTNTALGSNPAGLGPNGEIVGSDPTAPAPDPASPTPGTDPSNPGPTPGPGVPGSPAADDPGNPNKSFSITIDQLAKMADTQPLSLQRAMDAIKGILGLPGNPAKGTTIGKAAGIGAMGLGLLGTLAGPLGSLPGALAKGGAADAASRATAAMTSRGFTPNPTTLDAIINAMAKPGGPASGESGGGMFETGIQLGSGGMTPTVGTGTTIGTALAPAVAPAASGITPTTRANASARVGGGISPAFLEALQQLRAQTA